MRLHSPTNQGTRVSCARICYDHAAVRYISEDGSHTPSCTCSYLRLQLYMICIITLKKRQHPRHPRPAVHTRLLAPAPNSPYTEQPTPATHAQQHCMPHSPTWSTAIDCQMCGCYFMKYVACTVCPLQWTCCASCALCLLGAVCGVYGAGACQSIR